MTREKLWSRSSYNYIFRESVHTRQEKFQWNGRREFKCCCNNDISSFHCWRISFVCNIRLLTCDHIAHTSSVSGWTRHPGVNSWQMFLTQTILVAATNCDFLYFIIPVPIYYQSPSEEGVLQRLFMRSMYICKKIKQTTQCFYGR